jgi:SAM-dependent methyltransferase
MIAHSSLSDVRDFWDEASCGEALLLPEETVAGYAAQSAERYRLELDHVYSWGVLHHSPDTPKAIAEAMRVLRPGGTFAIMVYNKWSLVGLMLWARYGLARGRPLTSLETIYARYLESPGTKAYTPAEAKALVVPFATNIAVRAELTHGDLLSSGAGQRHEGRLLDLARRVWPRRLLKRVAANNGLFLLISGQRT